MGCADLIGEPLVILPVARSAIEQNTGLAVTIKEITKMTTTSAKENELPIAQLDAADVYLRDGSSQQSSKETERAGVNFIEAQDFEVYRKVLIIAKAGGEGFAHFRMDLKGIPDRSEGHGDITSLGLVFDRERWSHNKLRGVFVAGSCDATQFKIYGRY